MNTKQLSDIGGKCPSCHSEDQWKILDRQLEPGSYWVFYEVRCLGKIFYADEGPEEICNYVREFSRDESPEYEKGLHEEQV